MGHDPVVYIKKLIVPVVPSTHFSEIRTETRLHGWMEVLDVDQLLERPASSFMSGSPGWFRPSPPPSGTSSQDTPKEGPGRCVDQVHRVSHSWELSTDMAPELAPIAPTGLGDARLLAAEGRARRGRAGFGEFLFKFLSIFCFVYASPDSESYRGPIFLGSYFSMAGACIPFWFAAAVLLLPCLPTCLLTLLPTCLAV